MNAIDSSGKSTARKLVWVIDEFRKLGAPVSEREMDVNTMLVFFLVVSNPGISMKEIEKASGLSASAVSRNVLLLSDRSYRKGADGRPLPGMDLVVTASHPFDVRAKVVTPTPKGRKLFERVTMTMQGRL